MAETTALSIIAGLLLLALVVSNIIWMRYSQTLINKLMSRNYHEYAATREQVRGPKQKSAKAEIQPPKPETFRSPKENIQVLGPMISS